MDSKSFIFGVLSTICTIAFFGFCDHIIGLYNENKKNEKIIIAQRKRISELEQQSEMKKLENFSYKIVAE